MRPCETVPYANAGLAAPYLPTLNSVRGQRGVMGEQAIGPDKLMRSSPSAEHFATLMAAVAGERDRSAFAEIYDHFAPRLKGYLRRRGSDAGQAEELAQEIMLTVWRKARLYDPAQANVSTWIFTIARNRRIDALRRERRPEFDATDPAFVPDNEPSPDDALAASQDSAMLRRAIEDIPDEQGTLLRMAFYDDKSHSSIADELGLPLGTVKSRIRLALAKLRRSIEEDA
jgi:RNA polymerase sigma-70 factor (ECF subfamily)